MALKGDLGTIQLTDIFQTLANNQSRGTLVVYDKDSRKRIYFEGGRIILLTSGKRRGFRIGKILVGRKKITPNELNAALREQEIVHEPLGKILINMGVIAEADVQDAVKFQIEEEIYSLFTWTNAQFEFSPDSAMTHAEVDRSGEMISLSLDMQALLMEAARRADEWQGIARVIGSPREVYRCTGGIAQPLVEENLDENATAELLLLFDGTRSVEDVSNETAYGSFTVSKALARFIEGDLVRPATVGELVEAAGRFAEAGDIEKCLRFYELAASHAEGDIEVLEKVARTYEQFGKGHMAAAKYNTIGELFHKSGNLSLAAQYFERALAMHGADTEVLNKLFQIYNRLLDVPATIRTGRRLAALYDEIGRHDESKSIYEMLLQLDPHDIASRRKLLNIVLDSGQFQEAEEHYERLANDYLALGQTAHALEVLRKMLVIRPLRNDVKRRISALQNRVARRRRLKIAAVLGALIAGLALLAGGYEYKAGAFRQELDSAIAAAESREDYETEVECLQMLINAYPHSIAAWKASKQMAAINEKKDLFYGKQIKLLTQSARTEEAEGRLDKALEVLQRLRDFTREQGVKQSAEDDMARIKAYLTEAEALWVLAEKYRRENRLKEVFEYNYKIYWEYPKSQRAREARLPLSIMSLPQGAGVYDGKLLLGPTPYVLYYPPARPPVLRISSPGFADVRYDVAQNLSPAFQDGWKVFLELTKPLHWRFRTQQPVEAPPAVHKDRLIFGSRDGYIYCVEDADGKLAWKTQLGAMADVVAQPLILNDRVYTGAFDGILYCLDAATGKAVWSVKVGGMLRSSPTASDDAALVFITSESGKIIAVNAETGDVKWTVNAGDVVSCAAVPYGGKVFAATKEGALLCLNQADGAEVWRINLGSGVSCAPAAADQKIYVGLWNGAMLCLSAENGKTLWKFDSRSAVRTAPVLAAGSLLFGNEDGWLFRLSLDDGRQIWQYRSRGAIHSAPEVVSDGKRVVFGCSDGSLYALDFADGAPQWKFHTDGPVDSRPLRNNGKIYFGSNDNSLYCIDE